MQESTSHPSCGVHWCCCKWYLGVCLRFFPESLPTISCRPLQDILDDIVSKGNDHNVLIYLDFFSLDVEGAELDVLESIDWKRTSFGIVLIEADGSNQEKEKRILSLMDRTGYRFLYNRQRSLWFVHKDFSNIYKHLN
mmetsp:Transcript_5391/g.10278  ORF Transcript_5391/g.10278 Transcript_5391/m.10278 type:complete len:138 (-) Transcript_5391:15-428(-)